MSEWAETTVKVIDVAVTCRSGPNVTVGACWVAVSSSEQEAQSIQSAETLSRA